MSTECTKILLVRHGETRWNLENRFQGGLNSDLTQHGRVQAKNLALNLSKVKIDKIYSSPAPRALETAHILVNDRELHPISINELREIELGPWEGLTKSEAEKLYPEQFSNFWTNPESFQLSGAETFSCLLNRVGQTIENLFNCHKGKNIIIVSHWMSINAALNYYSKNESKSYKNHYQIENARAIELQRKQGETFFTL